MGAMGNGRLYDSPVSQTFVSLYRQRNIKYTWKHVEVSAPRDFSLFFPISPHKDAEVPNRRMQPVQTPQAIHTVAEIIK